MSAACPRCGYDPSAAVRAAWSFVVERDPPTLNARIVNAGDSRFRYAKERDLWVMEFRVQRVNHRIPRADQMRFAPGPTPHTMTSPPRRRVTLRRVWGGRQRERDKDNLIGGMKVVVDAMVLEGLLADDSAARAEIHYEQIKHGSDAGHQDWVSRVGLHVIIEDLA